MAPKLNRREFLKTTAVLSVVAATGCPSIVEAGIIVFRGASGGRRVSNAIKKHNANRLYLTELDCIQDPAHPGDNSYPVPVSISADLYNDLFANGRRVADLRVHR